MIQVLSGMRNEFIKQIWAEEPDFVMIFWYFVVLSNEHNTHHVEY